MSTVLARASASGDCTKDTCPASASIYGYAPSWDFNFFFTIHFIISALIFYHQALFWPKWRAFSIACILGCLMEAGGYVGRLMLHKDPFSNGGFKLNVTLLTVAPAFTSAAIYLILKKAILTFGQHLALFRPSLYVYFFVASDVVSIILQGAGGAISAIAEDKDLLDQGVNIMIAGLVSQVITLTIYLALVVEYFVKCKRNVHDLNPGSLKLVSSARFQLFAAAVSVAFLCIYARCCYRVAELWGGWGNHIMREEAEFIILDSDMCALAVLLLGVFHPQVFFKAPERVKLEDLPMKLDVEKPLEPKIQEIPDMPIRSVVRPVVRVTFNEALTEWERDGVRNARVRW